MSTIIGLVSTFRLPLQKSGRMDFEVEGRCAEVQKERERAEDWTLRRRGDVRKSKRSEQEWQNGL